MKRKAQSEIITTFALILIVLAGIAIVWYIVMQLVPPTDPFRCSDIQLKITEARSSDITGLGAIVIQRKSGGEGLIKTVKILVNGSDATIQRVNDVVCQDDPALAPPNQAFEDLGDLADPADDELDNTIEECAEVHDGRTAYSLDKIETKTYYLSTGAPGDIHSESLVEIAAIIENDGVEEVCNVIDRKRAS